MFLSLRVLDRGEEMSLPNQTAIYPVLLKVLHDLGGRARPKEVYPRVTQHFPEIRPEDRAVTLKHGDNQWQKRVQWARQHLVIAGLIDRSERGVWTLTAEGQEYVRRGATGNEIASLVRTRTPQPPPKPAPKGSRPPVGATKREKPISHPESVSPPSLTPFSSQSERLIAELRSAAVDARDPTRLEQAVADAFRFLGYDAEWIGGPGRTDVLIQAPLGIRRYRVVIDAKTSGRGKVSDQQIDWLSIKAHREQTKAEYACIVGPEFAAGHLATRAEEFQITLLTVEELAELIQIHDATPLTLTELRSMFETIPLARTVLPQLRAAGRERRRKRRLLVEILLHLDHFNRTQPDLILAKPEPLFASIVTSGKDDLRGTTIEEVRRCLSLLETLGIVSPINGDGFVSNTSMAGGLRLLTALLMLDADDLAEIERRTATASPRPQDAAGGRL